MCVLTREEWASEGSALLHAIPLTPSRRSVGTAPFLFPRPACALSCHRQSSVGSVRWGLLAVISPQFLVAVWLRDNGPRSSEKNPAPEKRRQNWDPVLQHE